MNDALALITATEARTAGERAIADGLGQPEVAVVVMRAARGGFMAPNEDTAFMAAVAALWNLYPDDEALRQETRAIGDRNKTLQALVNGVPVDMKALELTPMPEPALGLIDLWRQSGD